MLQWFLFLFHALFFSQQPEIKDLVWRDVNFLHTTDTHGWYSGHANQKQYHANWGDFVSFTHHARRIAKEHGQDLIVVDTGDRHDGNGLSDATDPNGARSLPIFIQEDYDLLTIGNHELYLWENSQQEASVVASHFGEKYVCSNVEYLDENGDYVPFGNKYRYFTTENNHIRVLSLAFLFDFNRNNDKTRVTPIEDAINQKWFNDVLDKYPPSEVDLLVIFGHIPVAHSWHELYVLHRVLRQKYPQTKIQYFGGHSHIRDFSVFDANSTGLQSGRFCETVGWLSVDLGLGDVPATEAFSRSYIDFNLDSFLHHTDTASAKDFETDKGLNVSKSIHQARKDLSLESVKGYVTLANYFMDYVPLDHPRNLFKLLTDKVLRTIPRKDTSAAARFIIINTGSVRYDLYKGPYTIDTEYIISPFKNDWASIRVPLHVAEQIAPTINRGDFIVKSRLKPLHHYARRPQVGTLEGKKVGTEKLSRGYVTHDDFGTDGDDTVHRGVVNFPVTNVVQSIEKFGYEDTAEVVFYKFIEWNILEALKQIGYHEPVTSEFYSDKYLGQLLTEYVQQGNL